MKVCLVGVPAVKTLDTEAKSEATEDHVFTGENENVPDRSVHGTLAEGYVATVCM